MDREETYNNTVGALRQDAEEHIKAGTIVLPVDVKKFALRLYNAAHSPVGKLVAMATLSPLLELVDYEKAVREVCTDLKLEMKERDA